MTDLDFYVNFVMHAILGRLAEADQIARVCGEPLRRISTRLAKLYPIPTVSLYRGILLDPDQPFDLDAAITFLSWSEDPDVARWFACPRSVVSEPLASQNAKLQGFLIRVASPPAHVLFHHAWAKAFGDLASLALAHPRMGEEGRRQIAWSLDTQREIITEPADDLRPERALELDACALEALERRLAPPWVLAEEGPRT